MPGVCAGVLFHDGPGPAGSSFYNVARYFSLVPTDLLKNKADKAAWREKTDVAGKGDVVFAI